MEPINFNQIERKKSQLFTIIERLSISFLDIQIVCHISSVQTRERRNAFEPAF